MPREEHAASWREQLAVAPGTAHAKTRHSVGDCASASAWTGFCRGSLSNSQRMHTNPQGVLPAVGPLPLACTCLTSHWGTFRHKRVSRGAEGSHQGIHRGLQQLHARAQGGQGLLAFQQLA